MTGKNLRKLHIALLPGDGQGPTLASHAELVLNLIQQTRRNISFDVTQHHFGGAALEAGESQSLPFATLNACREADAVIACGIGDARYGLEPERGLLTLRQELGCFANIRPIKFPSSSLAQLSAFKADRVEDLDVTFVRELTGGVYYGDRSEASDGEDGAAVDTTRYTKSQITRLARVAGSYAMQFNPPKPVHSIDKHNIMATSRLWRSIVTDVFEKEFPAVPLRHTLVDTAAMLLSSNPTSLNGIILTENLFGDILSDQAAGILPSPCLLASAALTRARGGPGLFEPFEIKIKGELVNPLSIIQAISLMLETSLDLPLEAQGLVRAIRRTLDPIELIGTNVRTVDIGGNATADEFTQQLLQHFDYELEAINSAEMAAEQPQPDGLVPVRPTERRPMGVIEKIITHAAVGLSDKNIKPGEMICVKVDWTITSELLWGGMEKTYDQMGRPRPFRNDRLWLAVDHTVDPRTNHLPKQKGLIAKAEKFRREAKIIDFLPANTSIMHTDFTRDRAQPGRIVVGSDSHTCSAGSMGSLAVGFGAADVVMPMVTGETWFRLPEVCRINFVGNLPFGVGGKDVILHILGLFRRNTIAFQRAVEYGGPGLAELSMDARFAIANMTTELGGMGACFEADEATAAWIAARPKPEHREGGLYFRADSGAQYTEERTIDLSDIKLTIAIYPDPDNVVPVTDKIGMRLDGCFIGACTTTEEDLIVGALVLEAGLKAGLTPVRSGKRRVTPGSLLIIKTLNRLGLIIVYEQAGFEVGAPGCSYCVGINDVDVAGEGEVWLSSQNRNFRNRMGKGSLGNITCAAVVAASSFSMTVTDPTSLLNQIDKGKFSRLLKPKHGETKIPAKVSISELNPSVHSTLATLDSLSSVTETRPNSALARSKRIIQSKVQRFGDNVDTDAIIPAEFMPGIDNADLGSHCFQYFRPEFRDKANTGSRIIVAEHGFGSGSSREDAVRALLGSGIEAVIAKGFAFIYERNQLNMGLFNLKIQDPEFYDAAVEDSVITIDKDNQTIRLEGVDKVFKYEQSKIEQTLLDSGGILPLYNQFGRRVFRHITSSKAKPGASSSLETHLGQPVAAGGGCSSLKNTSSMDW
ncbi:unnamed protein product [Clonostachys rosea]|uniref:Isopropylmalate dehydrogenase-like domain-containing protein n=1 Tax=Bionectria ochroleuca TaxID=29856 RepID=A0ABY6UWV9_BIOOC|nr:unnamed protein product [Clonostachys rosea]